MGAGGADYHNRKEIKAKIRKLRADVKRYEQEINATELRISEIENQLSDPEISGDYKKAMELSESLNALQEKLEELMELWDTALRELEETEGE